MKLHQACDEFLTHCRVSKNLSVHTLRAYTIDLQEFRTFAGDDSGVAEIDRQCLRGFLRHLFDVRKLKETSVKRRLACVKVMFRWLELDEVISISPFHRLDARIRMPRKLPRCLSRDESNRLQAEPAQRLGLASLAPDAIDRAIPGAALNDLTTLVAIEVLLATGVRVGELAAIQRDDIDLLQGVVTINGKGNRQRRVFLTDATMVALVQAYLNARKQAHPTSSAFLVTSRGRPASPQFLRKLVREAGQAAELPRRTTPHMLRHTAAIQLLEAGVDIRFVQRLLGHQSISTTEGYTSVSDGSLKTVITEAREKMGKMKR
ncbi:MAG: tyrosine-type recombinase/integrase [Candidatus Methylumidiphilus sp.]